MRIAGGRVVRWAAVIVALAAVLSGCGPGEPPSTVPKRTVFVTTVDAARGTPPGESGIEERSVEATSVPPLAVTSREELARYVFCREIRAGEVLTRRMLTAVVTGHMPFGAEQIHRCPDPVG